MEKVVKSYVGNQEFKDGDYVIVYDKKHNSDSVTFLIGRVYKGKVYTGVRRDFGKGGYIHKEIAIAKADKNMLSLEQIWDIDNDIKESNPPKYITKDMLDTLNNQFARAGYCFHFEPTTMSTEDNLVLEITPYNTAGLESWTLNMTEEIRDTITEFFNDREVALMWNNDGSIFWGASHPYLNS